MRGLFITFEGVDCCGKSTQLKLLSEYLYEKGIKVTTTREPGGCRISEEIRAVLLNPENKSMTGYTEAMLYAAARSQHISEVILPAIERGEVVLSDRYIDSSVAYQAYGRELGLKTVLALNSFALENCQPDYTLFFDITPEQAFERMEEGRLRDRLEQSGREFFMRTYKGFKEQAMRERRIITIDGTLEIDEIKNKVRAFADENILARYE